MPADDLTDGRLFAILRGLTPARAAAVGQALAHAGVRVIEVPLNSPEPFRSIEMLRRSLPAQCLVGAGTVLAPDDVARVFEAGGHLVVTPNVDADIIARTRALKMSVIPGFATPTEAFAAIKAGADRLKLFPASSFGPGYLKALKGVLPAHVRVVAVGGIAPTQMQAWADAGADGFGLGGELFRPDTAIDEIAARAREAVDAVRRSFEKQTTIAPKAT